MPGMDLSLQARDFPVPGQCLGKRGQYPPGAVPYLRIKAMAGKPFYGQ